MTTVSCRDRLSRCRLRGGTATPSRGTGCARRHAESRSSDLPIVVLGLCSVQTVADVAAGHTSWSWIQSRPRCLLTAGTFLCIILCMKDCIVMPAICTQIQRANLNMGESVIVTSPGSVPTGSFDGAENRSRVTPNGSSWRSGSCIRLQ